MIYVLYSPAHQETRKAFTKTNGEFVEEKVFEVESRAIYRCKGLPRRRYRSEYPNNKKTLFIAKFRTVKAATEEQLALYDYCGETFEIREWINGQIGEVVNTQPAESEG
jgi:hypothetical protein